MYNCQSYYSSTPKDTTAIDSTAMSDEEIILDEDGNIKVAPNENNENESATTTEKEATPKNEKRKGKVKEQIINFEQL